VKQRYHNGLGYLILSGIIAVTPLVPKVAMSAPVADWQWDENGRVYDASGNYVRVEMETGTLPPFMYPELVASAGGDSGGSR